MSESNKAQIDYWNGRAGVKWAALQGQLDKMLAPVTAELQARVGQLSGQRVLDVGCGTGETCTIWLSGGAEVTGVDVSVPMLTLAARRTGGSVTLIEADAATFRGNAPFDLVVSRFGVMFFAAPHQAFATIAGNLRPGGRLLFACWRAAVENEWVTTPLAAIQDLLPEAAPPEPHAPGPFALSDRPRLETILQQAGFTEVAITPFDCQVCLAHEGGVDAAVSFAMQVGPSGAALAEASDETRALAAERLKVALTPYADAGRVALRGAAWIVEAVRA